ncbi:hypothetical protein PNA2_1313 [Pyrococcus sp. NA2]|uniref:hypothetical protein n=1 Tax=Pyrococcus sp. (strain NA2) TaxID=342949 RepID=UPI000209AD71|nr:hypothetical protein [Pyrococcus sp. NA2]AEC52228.1 hypothetical protein PNA2_1313 [Pyrococcus sp. NA2]
MALSPYTISRREPSLGRILLVLFIFTTLTIYAVKYYLDNRLSPIEKRLYELGYPRKGFIATKENSSLVIKYADGSIVLKTGMHIDYYPVTAEEALLLARQHFAPINQRLKEYGLKIRFFIKEKTLTEKVKGDQRYWCFEVWQDRDGTKLNTYNYICVNRQTKAVIIESPFSISLS